MAHSSYSSQTIWLNSSMLRKPRKPRKPRSTRWNFWKQIREIKKTSKHKQTRGIVPGLGGCQKFVDVFFFLGSFLMDGGGKHINKIPKKSRDNPMKLLFNFFFRYVFFSLPNKPWSKPYRSESFRIVQYRSSIVQNHSVSFSRSGPKKILLEHFCPLPVRNGPWTFWGYVFFFFFGKKN